MWTMRIEGTLNERHRVDMQNDRVVSTPPSSSDPSAVPVWTTATGRFCITFTPGQVRMACNLMDLDLNELTMVDCQERLDGHIDSLRCSRLMDSMVDLCPSDLECLELNTHGSKYCLKKVLNFPNQLPKTSSEGSWIHRD